MMGHRLTPSFRANAPRERSAVAASILDGWLHAVRVALGALSRTRLADDGELTNPPPRNRSPPTPRGLGDVGPLHHAGARLDMDRIGLARETAWGRNRTARCGYRIPSRARGSG